MDTRVLRELKMGQIWKTRTYFSEHNEPVKNFKIFFSLLTLNDIWCKNTAYLSSFSSTPTQVVFDNEIGGKIKIVVAQKWGSM